MMSEIYARVPKITEATLLERIGMVSHYLNNFVAHDIEIRIVGENDLLNLTKEWGKTEFNWNPDTIDNQFPSSDFCLGVFYQDQIIGIGELMLEVSQNNSEFKELFQVSLEAVERKKTGFRNHIRGFITGCFLECAIDIAKTMGAKRVSVNHPGDKMYELCELFKMKLEISDPLEACFVLDISPRTSLNWSGLK